MPPSNATSTKAPADKLTQAQRSPYIPTLRELKVFALFPAILLFGTAFSVISPTVNRSEYNPITQSHSQEQPPSYFASKSNIFNVFYVKVGWAWITVAALIFAVLSPILGRAETSVQRRAKVIMRFLAVTGLWFLTTQWCFGPALVDRSFRLSGGMCHPSSAFSPTGLLVKTAEGIFPAELTANSAWECKRAGGKWHGGHDISGHVFMLCLGAGFLLQEVGWAVWPREKRTIVVGPGLVIEKEGASAGGLTGYTGKFALGLVALNMWMLLMTAIYFHTWFEKLSGLIVASASLYAVYVVPRFVPQLRDILGVPGLE